MEALNPDAQADSDAPSGRSAPSSLSAVFSGVMPYKSPRNELAAYVWRKRMLIEATTGLVNLEPWEKVVILSVMLVLPLCCLYASLGPALSALYAYIWRTLDFIGYVLTYPGLFVRIDDPEPLEEVQQWVVGNVSRAL